MKKKKKKNLQMYNQLIAYFKCLDFFNRSSYFSVEQKKKKYDQLTLYCRPSLFSNVTT